LLSFEAFGSWSYRLAGEAATIGRGLDAEVELIGGGLWAAAVTPDLWSLLSFKDC